VRKTAQQFVPAIMVHNRLTDDAPSRVILSASHFGTQPP